MKSRSAAARFTVACGSFVLLAFPTILDAAPVAVQEHLLEAKDQARSRTVPLKVYLPRETDSGPVAPKPVVIFSHGLGGSREGASYLGRHWAAAGYVAVFLQHPGSDESVWKDVPPLRRMWALREAAGADAFLQRVRDVPFVLDQLEQWNADPTHPLHARMDLRKIGMSGHSFGGVTTQAVMGQKYALERSFADPRLKAFLIMSPSPGRGNEQAKLFGHVTSPVMCMTGDKDTSPLRAEVTPESRREVYKALPAEDKFETVFADGSHFVFSDRDLRGRQNRDPRHHRAIQRLSTAFWDAYLKDDSKARDWLQSARPREILVAADIWQWK